jgi:hypothetical protein
MKHTKEPWQVIEMPTHDENFCFIQVEAQSSRIAELEEMLLAWYHAWRLDGPKDQAWKILHESTEQLLNK